MIIGYGVHGAKAGQVVFIGHIIPMKGHNIEGRVRHMRAKELATKLRIDGIGCLLVLKRGCGNLKVSWISKAISSYGTEVRQLKMTIEGFANIPTENSCNGLNPKTHSAGDNSDFSRRDL
jgi:hypothetical protein